ncbi:hypothetical protein [uncultured Clostridium sp.]|uniref:hypothetical protein n=1 Tax=uncultured Clostridium sp. TaxID=59620 RepID=UPI0026060031|nr:hypothetical protein [uncultured Clostridium sp.]
MDNNAKEENIIKYTYGYDNGFKIYKSFIENKKVKKKESLTFKIHEIDGQKILTHTIGEENLEYLNRNKGEFFKEFNIADFKTFKEDLYIICTKLKINPNYGDLMEEIIDESNVEHSFEVLNCLFSSKLFEIMIEEKLGYLVKENFLSNMKKIENNLCVNKAGKSLAEIWNMNKNTIKYFAENKVSLSKIIDSKNFMETRGVYDFEKVILQLGLNIDYINKIKELLDDNYEVDMFARYIEDIHKNEGLPKDIVLVFIADIKKISEELGITFESYMENLRDKHDIMVEKYMQEKEEKYNSILKESGKNIKIKQVDHKYSCTLLKEIDENLDEDDRTWILNYIERMTKEKIVIAELIKREEEKIFAILAIKGNKIIDIKRFYNKETRKDLNKYIHDLGKRNGWNSRML